MAIVLGGLTLTRVRSLRIVKAVTYPRHAVVGKSTGTLDPDNYVRDPDVFELVADVNNADRQTLQNTYLNTLRALQDSVDTDRLNETVHVESVECEYVTGHDFDSEFNWRCSIALVISNA